MAKDTAVNTCLAEIIYADMAEKDGYELTAEEKDAATEQAAKLLTEMTKAQIEKTGLTQALVQKIELRKALAARYAEDYVQKADLNGYEGSPLELISGNGAYFQNEILPEHQVVFVKKLLNQLYFGKITVNMGK